MAAKERMDSGKIYIIATKEVYKAPLYLLYFTINNNSILTKWYKGSILGLVNKRA